MIYIKMNRKSELLLALNQTFTVCRKVASRIHETFIRSFSAASKIKGLSRIALHVTTVNSLQLKYLRRRRA